MSIEVESSLPATDGYEHYRAVSSAAVTSLIVGLLSALALLDWTLVAVPVIGVALGLYAMATVRRRSDELSGAGLARAGFLLSLAFAILGPARLTYVYITELPEGYERVSYSALQPEDNQPGQIVPPSALALEGKKIFLKGYIYPGTQKSGIREFLLVRDQGDCCFGGNPKITDRIHVKLDDPLRLTYEPRLHNLGGTFHVEAQQNAIDGAKGGILYHLQADYLK